MPDALVKNLAWGVSSLGSWNNAHDHNQLNILDSSDTTFYGSISHLSAPIWMQVDLQREYKNIVKVTIIKRYYNHVRVEVECRIGNEPVPAGHTNAPFPSPNTQCGTIGTPDTTRIHTFDCTASPLDGQYVTLQTTTAIVFDIARLNIFRQGMCCKK